MWEANANINLFWTADHGDPIGSGSPRQGNAFHGDIRIGGHVQPSNIMAYFVNMGSGTLIAFGPAATAVAVQPNQGSGTRDELAPTADRKKAHLDPGDFIKIGSTLEPVDKLMVSPALPRREQARIAVQTKQIHPTAKFHTKHLVAASKKPQSVLS